MSIAIRPCDDQDWPSSLTDDLISRSGTVFTFYIG